MAFRNMIQKLSLKRKKHGKRRKRITM